MKKKHEKRKTMRYIYNTKRLYIVNKKYEKKNVKKINVQEILRVFFCKWSLIVNKKQKKKLQKKRPQTTNSKWSLTNKLEK